jgi:DNA-binding IclR family transcriptional regulator
MSNTSSVETVNRLVRILDCFSPDHPTWSLAELSKHLGLSKSTLHRFLVSLEFHGILRRSARDRRWRLGYRLSIWGSLAAESTGIQHLARPVMQDIAAATGEMPILTIYQNRQVVCIERIETNHSVRLALEVGMRCPPHAGASSKILMAYLPEEEIQAIIHENGLPKLCTNTITDPAELLNELAKIRAQGYAESVEETDPGAWGVATPIFDRDGAVVASIGIAGPTLRFSETLSQQYVSLCCQAAQRISALLRTGVEQGHQSLNLD